MVFYHEHLGGRKPVINLNAYRRESEEQAVILAR